MLDKLKKYAPKLVLVGVAACSVCAIPLAIPFIVAFAGGGAFVAGKWAIGSVFVLGLAYFVIKRRQKKCSCST